MSLKSPWRRHARKVIASVIKENPDKKPAELRRLISAAYPFGERKCHPYKIWCDEVKLQTGKKKPRRPGQSENPNQLTVF